MIGLSLSLSLSRFFFLTKDDDGLSSSFVVVVVLLNVMEEHARRVDGRRARNEQRNGVHLHADDAGVGEDAADLDQGGHRAAPESTLVRLHFLAALLVEARRAARQQLDRELRRIPGRRAAARQFRGTVVTGAATHFGSFWRKNDSFNVPDSISFCFISSGFCLRPRPPSPKNVEELLLRYCRTAVSTALRNVRSAVCASSTLSSILFLSESEAWAPAPLYLARQARACEWTTTVLDDEWVGAPGADPERRFDEGRLDDHRLAVVEERRGHAVGACAVG